MVVHPGSDSLAAAGGLAVAIGNFDGVHVGHQRLLALAGERARAGGLASAVLTFEPHPARVLAPALAPPLLITPARKRELIAAAGIDHLVLEPFTPELAALSPEAFVERILVAGLGAREVIVGYDFTYGRHRAGNIDTLRADGAARGFAVHVVPQVTVHGLVASSTKIREFLLEGNVEGARLLLGRDFDCDGTVVRGAGRGRAIGVPTANLAVEGEVLPRPGIYAVRARVGGDWHPAAASLGTNPTFVEGGPLTLEVHLLDLDRDLYDQRLRVAFHARLRDEARYPSAEALVAQIRRDIEAARTALKEGS
jgi:riboflavin kinase/FMN adenylyltransferase